MIKLDDISVYNGMAHLVLRKYLPVLFIPYIPKYIFFLQLYMTL